MATRAKCYALASNVVSESGEATFADVLSTCATMEDGRKDWTREGEAQKVFGDP
jgi:hypothetical protein